MIDIIAANVLKLFHPAALTSNGPAINCAERVAYG